jgi:hypothetical protein
MAVTPSLITVTVTTAGTRTRVTTNENLVPVAVYFEADAANTGQCYIGDVAVSSSSYFARLPIPSTSAAPSWSINSTPVGGRIGGTGIKLSDLYIDASVNGQKVHVTYIYDIGG